MVSETAQTNIFLLVSADLLAKKRREQKAETTMRKLEWLLGKAMPDLGQRPISSITAPEILAVLRRVELRGQLETAQRVRAVCKFACNNDPLRGGFRVQ